MFVHRYRDFAVVLKSLDQYLASCDKAEAARIDAISYSRMTGWAAIYRILGAIQMRRRTPSVHYLPIDGILRLINPPGWQLRRSHTETTKMCNTPRHLRCGHRLGKHGPQRGFDLRDSYLIKPTLVP